MGRIVPSSGVDQEYDNSIEVMAAIEEDLQAYLKKQCAFFGCKVSFLGGGS